VIALSVCPDDNGIVCYTCQQQGCCENYIQLAGSYCKNFLFPELSSKWSSMMCEWCSSSSSSSIVQCGHRRSSVSNPWWRCNIYTYNLIITKVILNQRHVLDKWCLLSSDWCLSSFVRFCSSSLQPDLSVQSFFFGFNRPFSIAQGVH